VTHLIVGEVGTPKYKYVAKQRPDIKCVGPKWVAAVRDVWIAGGDDIESLELKYRAPIFMGLIISITGFDDCGFFLIYCGLMFCY
jgi:DNA replication regulator DPB11